MQQLGFIMKGLAIVYQMQLATLEKETKTLLSMLNGDHVWNLYVKKNMKRENVKGRGGGIAKGKANANGMRALAFNIMDVKQLLDYTRGKLDNLQTQMLELPEND
jgi:hypothetical protein